uniref:MDM2 binding protein n=1 Tax=Varanus komodoensis TaxID=61221 RepID=A0A8D2LTJ3_VARKO
MELWRLGISHGLRPPSVPLECFFSSSLGLIFGFVGAASMVLFFLPVRRWDGSSKPGIPASRLQKLGAGTWINIVSSLKKEIICIFYFANALVLLPLACSVVGVPSKKEWYFAIQSICGFSQFCSSDWEDINFDLETDQSKNTIQRNIEECLGDIQSTEEEDSNSQESVSLIDLYEESAEGIHLLADKLPAPGKAMVDVIFQSSEREAPRLKDCLPVLGALKHMREWHAAKITIVANESKTSWQKIADYLSADVVAPENLKTVIDSRELWRGKIQIWERKVSVFHYYGHTLKFVQLVLLSQLPSSLMSDHQFELYPFVQEKSRLFWDQLSSLNGKIGALFLLPCSVSGMLVPLPSQLSTRKWKEYIARKPKVIRVPEVELKGETCNYYFLVQGNGCGGCKATMIYSASQINGSVTLAETIGKWSIKTEETEAGRFFVRSLPHFHGEQILQREKKLAYVQTLALNHCLKRQESARQKPLPNEVKTLLTHTRECFLALWNANHPNSVSPRTPLKTKDQGTDCSDFDFSFWSCSFSGSELKGSNPLKWVERHVLQNLENFEKIKQKTRVSEQLLAHKDAQKGSAALLDAKELLKHFTPEGLPIGDLQPLHIQKSDNAFLLTPELTPRKLRSLPFEKATGCHYHGLEYCLDNRRALERDVGFAELQARLIRYETQTTCTKECCPMPCVLSPLPSPAVLSEPGSVPDGESLQRDLPTEASRLKRRSKDMDGFYPNKRLPKPESTDSLLSQVSGSSGSHRLRVVTRQCLETSGSLPSVAAKPSHNWMHKVNPKNSSASQRCGKEAEIQKPAKESRYQKHTRMLKEVVTKTLEKHGIAEDHKCFATCSQRLFEISKCYLKDLKTSRGLFDEMKKAANSNVKQVIEWVLEKAKEK